MAKVTTRRHVAAPAVALSLVLLTSCGPSESEIQERIDEAIEEALATSSTSMDSLSATVSTNVSTSTQASTTTLPDSYPQYRGCSSFKSQLFEAEDLGHSNVFSFAYQSEGFDERYPLGEFTEEERSLVWPLYYERTEVGARWNDRHEALAGLLSPVVVASEHTDLLRIHLDLVTAQADLWIAYALLASDVVNRESTLPEGVSPQIDLPTQGEVDRLHEVVNDFHEAYASQRLLVHTLCADHPDE